MVVALSDHVIENISKMDRQVTSVRSRRAALLTGAAVAAGAIAVFAVPAVGRWHRADRAVDAGAVRYASVTRGDLTRDISVQGRVVAALSPTLFSPGQGIVSLRTAPGAAVRAGDLLAVIESRELPVALEQARAQLVAARAELDRARIAADHADLRGNQQVAVLTVRLDAARRQLARARGTFDKGLSSRIEYETAEDAVHVAELELQQATSELGLSRETSRFEIATGEQSVRTRESVVGDLQARVDELAIRAPFDGLVATVAVRDRDAVAANQPIASVVNLSSLEVEAELPEEYGREASAGTRATILFEQKEFPARLTRVSPEVVNSAVGVRVAFDGEPPAGLKQNERLTTRILFDARANVLKVPRGAFLEAEGGHAAYVVADRVAHRREIAVGAMSVAEVEIVSGLHESDVIVVSDTSGFHQAQTVLLR